MGQAFAVQPSSSKGRETWLVPGALFSLYIIWGSTYLAIRLAVIGPHAFAPFQLNALRFIFAGILLFLFLRIRGATMPTLLQQRNSALVGFFLIIGGNGLVTLGEAWGAPSGIAATVVATMPLWSGFWSGVFGVRTKPLEWLGMLVGVCGVALLTLEGSFRTNPATLILFCSPVCWSFGSIISKKLIMPSSLMASALEMFYGGVAALIVSLLLGEPWRMPDGPAWAAFFYLVFIGSMIAFNAYIYLLETVRPALATSYAYVNPAVALGFGLWLGKEMVDAKTFIALPIILAGVGIIAIAQNISTQNKNIKNNSRKNSETIEKEK